MSMRIRSRAPRGVVKTRYGPGKGETTLASTEDAMRPSTTLRVCILVLCSVVQVIADYTATVELKKYENPTHMRAQSNDCCDGNCSDPCDNRFRFCYTDSPDMAQKVGVLQVRPEEAVIGCQFASDLVAKDNDNFSFPSSGIFGETVRNPLKFKGQIWPGQAYLLVIVIDVDRDTLDDTVDAIVVPLLPSSLRRYSPHQTYRGHFGFSTLTARYRVDCDSNFFGEDCSVFCSDTDNSDGHYTCDRHGNRECLQGYQNVSANCTQCVPAIGCSSVGGYCTEPGDCVCLPQFTGVNCTEAATSGPQVCQMPSPPATATDSTPVSVVVYVLGVLVGVLLVGVVLVSVIVIVLIVCMKRRGKQRHNDRQSSRGYYINEGLGPTQSSINLVESHDLVETESERSSRQYATVDSNQRLADMLATAHVARDDDSSSYSTSLSPSAGGSGNDVPSSSLRPNVAYGIEQKRQNGGGYINGRRAPMRPPPRPPR